MANKRYSLLSVIDRLHVENAINNKRAGFGSPQHDQDVLQNFVNSSLLKTNEKKEELITVIPDEHGEDKEKRGILLKRSRKCCGNFVCAKCGHRIFKLNSRGPGAISKVSLNLSTQLQKRANESLNFCWKCSTNHFGGTHYQRNYTKSKVRPVFEHQLHGGTIDRASKSWHFIRRDFVCKKVRKLVAQKCNENEYREKNLLDISSDEIELFGSDSEDDGDDSDDLEKKECATKKHLPFLSKTSNVDSNLSVKESETFQDRNISILDLDLRDVDAYKEHISLLSDSDDDMPYIIDNSLEGQLVNLSPVIHVKRPVSLDNTANTAINHPDMFDSISLSTEVSQHEDLSTVPLPIELGEAAGESAVSFQNASLANDSKQKSDDGSQDRDVSEFAPKMSSAENEYFDVEYVENSIEKEMLVDIDSTIEILNIDSDVPSPFSQWFTPCLNNACGDICFCFNAKPACWKTIRNTCDKKPSKVVLKGKTNPSFYKGVCKLVTAISQKKNHYVDNSVNTCLYDTNGIYRKKSDLPSFVQLHDYKSSHIKKRTLKSKKKMIDTLLSQNISNYRHGLKIPSHADCISDITLLELKEKILSRYSKQASNNMVDGKSKRTGPPQIKCIICKRYVNKDAVFYSQDNAPSRFLVHFKSAQDKISLCNVCHTPVTVKISPLKSFKTKKVSTDCSEKTNNLKRPAAYKIKITSPVKIAKLEHLSDGKQISTRQISPKAPTTKRQNASFCRRFSTKMREPKFSVYKASTSVKSVENESSNMPSAAASNTSAIISVAQSQPSESHLGANALGQLNLKVVKNPDHNQLRSIAHNCCTKYVIVQTSPQSGNSKVKNLSTPKTLENATSPKLASYGDIKINGHKYKIDTEFKLNELVKDNENAVLSVESQTDILKSLPSILKRTIGTKAGHTNSFKIFNFMGNPPVDTSFKNTSVSTCETIPLSPSPVRSSWGQSIVSTPPQSITQVKACASFASLSEYVIVSASKMTRRCPDNKSSVLMDRSILIHSRENSSHTGLEINKKDNACDGLNTSSLPAQHHVSEYLPLKDVQVTNTASIARLDNSQLPTKHQASEDLSLKGIHIPNTTSHVITLSASHSPTHQASKDFSIKSVQKSNVSPPIIRLSAFQSPTHHHVSVDRALKSVQITNTSSSINRFNAPHSTTPQQASEDSLFKSVEIANVSSPTDHMDSSQLQTKHHASKEMVFKSVQIANRSSPIIKLGASHLPKQQISEDITQKSVQKSKASSTIVKLNGSVSAARQQAFEDLAHKKGDIVNTILPITKVDTYHLPTPQQVSAHKNGNIVKTILPITKVDTYNLPTQQQVSEDVAPNSTQNSLIARSVASHLLRQYQPSENLTPISVQNSFIVKSVAANLPCKQQSSKDLVHESVKITKLNDSQLLTRDHPEKGLAPEVVKNTSIVSLSTSQLPRQQHHSEKSVPKSMQIANGSSFTVKLNAHLLSQQQVTEDLAHRSEQNSTNLILNADNFKSQQQTSKYLSPEGVNIRNTSSPMIRLHASQLATQQKASDYLITSDVQTNIISSPYVRSDTITLPTQQHTLTNLVRSSVKIDNTTSSVVKSNVFHLTIIQQQPLISSPSTNSLVKSFSDLKPITNCLLPSVSRQIHQQIRTSGFSDANLQPVSKISGNRITASSDRIKIVDKYLNANDMKGGTGSAGFHQQNVSCNSTVVGRIKDAKRHALGSIYRNQPSRIVFNRSRVLTLDAEDPKTGAVNATSCSHRNTVTSNFKLIDSNDNRGKKLVVSRAFDQNDVKKSHASKVIFNSVSEKIDVTSQSSFNQRSIDIIRNENSNTFNGSSVAKCHYLGVTSSNVNTVLSTQSLVTRSEPVLSSVPFHSKSTTCISDGPSAID